MSWKDQTYTVMGRKMPGHQMRGGTFYHGSARDLPVGTVLKPGHGRNFEESDSGSVSITSDPNRAAYWATESGEGTPYVYVVEPLGNIEMWRVGLANFGKEFVVYEARVPAAEIVGVQDPLVQLAEQLVLEQHGTKADAVIQRLRNADDVRPVILDLGLATNLEERNMDPLEQLIEGLVLEQHGSKADVVINRLRNADDVRLETAKMVVDGTIEPIGAGASRQVYAIDADYVLKVDSDNKYSQNQSESGAKLRSVLRDYMPHIYDRSEDRVWMVVERVTVVQNDADYNQWAKKAGIKFNPSFSAPDLSTVVFRAKQEESSDQSELINRLIELESEIKLWLGDFKYSNLGFGSDGRPVIIDLGFSEEFRIHEHVNQLLEELSCNEEWGKYVNVYHAVTGTPIETVAVETEAELPQTIEFLRGKHDGDEIVIRTELEPAMQEEEPFSAYILQGSQVHEEATPSKIGQKDDIVMADLGQPPYDNSVEDIFDMIDGSYERIGGHLKIKSPDDVLNYPKASLLDIDDDPEADLFTIAKANGKVGASGTDGSKAARVAYKQVRSDMTRDDWWSEVSGKPAELMLADMDFISTQEEVEEMLGKPVEWHGEHPEGKFPGYDGWYTRKIGGKAVTKIMVKN